MTNEKLSTIRNNISDATAAPYRPIGDNDLIFDLRIKINMFDLALDGLERRSEYSQVEQGDILDLSYAWANLMTNLEIAVPLLQYIEEVLDQDSEAVELEDIEGYQIPVRRLRGAIDRYREKNKEMIKHWENKGWR